MDKTELSIKAPVVNAKLTHHIFVCTGASCTKNESEKTLEKFWAVLKDKNLLYGKRGSLDGSVIVTPCGSIGFCQTGPAVLIYPDGIWYHSVTADDVEELVESHLINGSPLQRLLGYQMN